MQTSIFQIRFVRAAFALAFLSGLLQPAFAVPGGNCGAVDRLTVALRFAQVLFPELKARSLASLFRAVMVILLVARLTRAIFVSASTSRCGTRP